MRILVVGGAGFIGSHLVDRLLAEQHTVDVVDDLSAGSLANLADARAAGGELKIHHLDVCAPEFPALVAMRTPDVVYHLGWAPPGRFDPAVAGRAIHGTVQVLESARAADVAKVVTALPAGALYGEVPARDLPLKEGHDWQPVGAEGVVARAVAELFAPYRTSRRGVHRWRWPTCTDPANASTVAWWRRSPSPPSAARRPCCTATASSRATSCSSTTWSMRSSAATRGGGLVVNIGTGTPTRIVDLWAALAGADAAAPAGGQAAPTTCRDCRCRRHEPGSSWPGPRGPTSRTVSPTSVHLGADPGPSFPDVAPTAGADAIRGPPPARGVPLPSSRSRATTDRAVHGGPDEIVDRNRVARRRIDRRARHHGRDRHIGRRTR
ncbi:MAG: NAD-dependent epimerase/dehydratase family protein [Ilumatobacteraceae bacterium]